MPKDSEQINWYVVNCYAGQENRVKDNLEKRITTMGLENSLLEVYIPEETEIEYKNGKEIKKTHNLFSGYILVRMLMTDEAWYIVRNTPGVTGFIGSSGKGAKPFPVAAEEVEAIKKRLENREDTITVDVMPGDRVEVIDGALKGNIVDVVSVDPVAKKIKASYHLFGEQLADLNFSEIQKIDSDK